MCNDGRFTAEEEERIQREVEEYQKRQREAEIEAEIRNRIADEQRKQPGYAGY